MISGFLTTGKKINHIELISNLIETQTNFFVQTMLDICAYKLNRKAKEHKVCNEVKVVLQKEISEAIKMSKSNISRNLKYICDKRYEKYMFDLALRKADERKKKKALSQKFSFKMQKIAKNLLD